MENGCDTNTVFGAILFLNGRLDWEFHTTFSAAAAVGKKWRRKHYMAVRSWIVGDSRSQRGHHWNQPTAVLCIILLWDMLACQSKGILAVRFYIF